MSDTARDRAEKLAAERYPKPPNDQQRTMMRRGVNLASMRLNERMGYINGYMARDAEVAAELAAAEKRGAVKALREAAQIVEDAAKLHSHPTHEVAAEALRIAGWRLRLRADEIERATDDH